MPHVHTASCMEGGGGGGLTPGKYLRQANFDLILARMPWPDLTKTQCHFDHNAIPLNPGDRHVGCRCTRTRTGPLQPDVALPPDTAPTPGGDVSSAVTSALLTAFTRALIGVGHESSTEDSQVERGGAAQVRNPTDLYAQPPSLVGIARDGLGGAERAFLLLPGESPMWVRAGCCAAVQ